MVVWFWQLIISPHMAGLARALAEQGVNVVYVAQHEMSPNRAKQGWTSPPLGKVELKLAPMPADATSLAISAPTDAVHICQGIRGNGQIGLVQQILAKHGRKQWVVMETVEDSGWRGIVKRVVYHRLFSRLGPHLQGVLATGYRTPDWVVARGVPPDKVFPFAYFLPDDDQSIPLRGGIPKRFRVLFVGQFIKLKRLDLLIAAMTGLDNPHTELAIIGSGPLEQKLRQQVEQKLPGRVDWIGRLTMSQVHQQMALADCLVLPSRHDGWGAVVSEALMVGTPVICSDHCGAAGVVQASGAGAIFRSGSKGSLQHQLQKIIAAGSSSREERVRLVRWATSLGAQQGAKYLLSILESEANWPDKPQPPWLQ